MSSQHVPESWCTRCFLFLCFLNKLSDQMFVLEKVTIEQAQVLMSLKRTS